MNAILDAALHSAMLNSFLLILLLRGEPGGMHLDCLGCIQARKLA